MKIKTLITVLAIISVAALSTAGASSLDTSLNEAATNTCNVIKGITASKLVGVFAVAMFVAGIGMTVAKMRGGLAMIITAIVGYFVVKNGVSIANSFGLTSC